MKKSIFLSIILSVIAFSQNGVYTVSSQTNKSKSALDISNSGENSEQKLLKMRSDNTKNEKLAFGTLVYEGRTYKTVIINGKEWMAENLAYLPTVNAPTQTSTTEPCYYVYDYTGSEVSPARQQANYTSYGVLYNFPAAKASCPPGWHLPSDAEWTVLENFLISNGFNYDETTSENKIAKSLAARTKWNTNAQGVGGAIGNDLSLNNKTGFSALPGGIRKENSKFEDIGNAGFWWSSTQESTGYNWMRYLHFKVVKVFRRPIYLHEGISVRCVKD